MNNPDRRIKFYWERRSDRLYGVKWELTADDSFLLGVCLYMPGSRNWQVRAFAPTKGGSVLTWYSAGTAAACRRALERDWDKRSIGLFGVDDIEFMEQS